jgi:twitching motility protein PilI
MAKSSSLREYQSGIIARLEAVKAAGAEVSQSYLGVMIGERHVLVNLQDISETSPIVEIQPVPLVKPWFLGMSNVRGVLYAVNDLAKMLDGVSTVMTSSTRLLLMNDSVVSNVAFLVDKLVGLRKLDEMQLTTNVVDDELCLKPESYEDADKRLWYVLDSDKLVRSREFSAPYLV